MVELLAEAKGNEVYEEYLPALQKEYNYWMDETGPTKHIVKMPDGSVLNRYYDQLDTPRPESYRQDVETSEASKEDPKVILPQSSLSGREWLGFQQSLVRRWPKYHYD